MSNALRFRLKSGRENVSALVRKPLHRQLQFFSALHERVKPEVPVFFLLGNNSPLYWGRKFKLKGQSLTREDREHCGCCTYLAFMDPVLHSIVSEHGAKLGIPGHCPCCRYLKSKGVHDDIAEARKFRRGDTDQGATTRRLVGRH